MLFARPFSLWQGTPDLNREPTDLESVALPFQVVICVAGRFRKREFKETGMRSKGIIAGDCGGNMCPVAAAARTRYDAFGGQCRCYSNV